MYVCAQMYICPSIVHRYVSNTDMCQILFQYTTYFTINLELFVFQYIVCLHVFTCKYFVPDHTLLHMHTMLNPYPRQRDRDT